MLGPSQLFYKHHRYWPKFLPAVVILATAYFLKREKHEKTWLQISFVLHHFDHVAWPCGLHTRDNGTGERRQLDQQWGFQHE